MKYKVRLIKEYIKTADSKEEAIESAKFAFDYSNDSSFCQRWDKVQCRELKAESAHDVAREIVKNNGIVDL